ncbi:MAG: hypothetical protein JWM54_2154 [Acidobacteriaceae bacterium]|jgi:hypothetical protein|nr:hypothetical protein [Acidobacteriaceae bacterium]
MARPRASGCGAAIELLSLCVRHPPSRRCPVIPTYLQTLLAMLAQADVLGCAAVLAAIAAYTVLTPTRGRA